MTTGYRQPRTKNRIEKAAHPEPQRIRTHGIIAAAHAAGQTALYDLALAARPPLKKNENAG